MYCQVWNNVRISAVMGGGGGGGGGGEVMWINVSDLIGRCILINAHNPVIMNGTLSVSLATSQSKFMPSGMPQN